MKPRKAELQKALEIARDELPESSGHWIPGTSLHIVHVDHLNAVEQVRAYLGNVLDGDPESLRRTA